MIKKKEIERLAFFARIKLDKEELQNVPQEITSILEYIQKLSNVDTEGVEPLFHFSELKNVVRKDKAETIEREIQKEMMSMGKDKDDYLKVESIL
jgi:aspartyl-tRNA(Asn)/glutamyl-tRNA(Gln) amidotransferase subunit C